MFRTSNPTLSSQAFQETASQYGGSVATGGAGTMSVGGSVQKTLILLLLVSATFIFSWTQTTSGAPSPLFMWGGAIGGFIVAMVTVFKKEWSPITAPIYALLEGLFLGGISSFFEAQFPGIVVQAVFLTFGVMFALLLAYQSGVIKATPAFKKGIIAATGGIFLFYLASFILGFFGINMGFVHGSSMLGIGFSLVVVVIAALNLVLDFDFIEQASKSGAPKFMEWYAAFGLLVTLIWLYIEILRLLSKLQRR
jgi:uncharacterized YccA/Bax inhibitor family protein